MTLVHMGTVISPLRVEASIVTLTIRGSADTNSKTRTFNIDSLRRSARHPDPRTSMSYSVNSYATLHHLSKRHSNAPIADLCFSLLTPMERYIIYSSRTWAPAFPFCFLFLRHTSTAQKCGALSSELRSPYWGLSGATNWELIQPFQRVFSTWTQSPSRPVAVNCVPLGAVPRTGAFAEGADLMLTPGRCKKTRSGFCAVDVVWGVTAPTWGEAAAVSEAATSGEGTTPDAPGDGSATVGAGCT